MSTQVDLLPRNFEFHPESSQLQPTFRDPAGQLHLTPTHALRRVRPAAVAGVRAFLASPLRAALERSGELIASEIAAPETHPVIEPDELWLRHPRIDPITYPWEWTGAQWRAAADLTLRIATQAIDAGWTLKDATPLNILFRGAEPVLVDALSFERRDPASSIWLAYGQFVRTFLLPLLAEKHLGWSLQATLFSRDGYEPATLYRALRPWQRLAPDLLGVVTLATLLEGRPGQQQRLPAPADPELATHLLHRRLKKLARQILRTAPAARATRWSNYQQTASHYSADDVAAKQQFVRNVLERCHPGNVLDIGANTGFYSRQAAATGARVVAIDSDGGAIEALWLAAGRDGLPITALVANIARPTPAAGWRNREQLSLLDRLTGKFDLVLMLAVIHHLILREQLPLDLIGELMATLTRRWLLVEWVPSSDPMFQQWLRGRDDLYGDISEEDLRQAFAPHFRVADRQALTNGRVLLLFERAGVC
jgi:SAM-dependent methyltransferase